MKLSHHAIISGVASTVVVAVNAPITLGISLFIAGVFIDLDHWFDYFREYGMRMNVNRFFAMHNATRFRKLILPLHAWEWILILAAVTLHRGCPPLLCGVTLGLGLHMALDQWSNGGIRSAYFFTARMRLKFKTSQIFPGKGID